MESHNEMLFLQSNNKIENYNFFKSSHKKHFNILNLNFFSSDQQITLNYKIKEKTINNLIKETKLESSVTSEEYLSNIQNLREEKENIELSYQILINSTIKDKYMHFLFINFIFSQPNTLEKLKQNFRYLLFPYFIFLIDTNKSSINSDYLIIDYPKRMINFCSKNCIIKGISLENVIKIDRKFEIITISTSKNDEIFIKSEIQQQRDLIFTLILFMLKLKEDQNILNKRSNKIDESNLNVNYTKKSSLHDIMNSYNDYIDTPNFNIDKLELLKEDSYLPSGIILKSFVLKQHKNNFRGYGTRYIVLGNSNIIIFKDETMSHICNLIPILHCNILFHFEEQILKLNIRIPSREYVFYFKSIDDLQLWRTTVNNLCNLEINEKIEEDIIINLLDTNSCADKNFQQIQSKSELYLEFLNSKIENIEEKLSKLILRRDNIIKMQKSEKNELLKTLDYNLESENIQDVQENYINNRRKRISEMSSRKNSNII